ncbi:MAG: thiol peroxidase [Candidatus Krumholzibacteria bacterium]|jgi:thiol peroxidase|nr:thiol peroxidase [Candidatus Krumholzibacteria bacterium]
MAQIKLKGNPLHTSGDLPAVGAKAPDFTLVGVDLGEIKLADLRGRKVVLNVFTSLDTSVCASSIRRFNEEAGKRDGVTVLCVSMDLPFAAVRFCTAEGLDNVVTGSDFRDGAFGRAYGLRIEDGPIRGLLARAVILLDAQGTVMYTELVTEHSQEPNYDAVLALLG